MKYYQISEGSVYWQLYCKKEEIERLRLDKYLHRSQKKWDAPEVIEVYVDTQYPEHPEIDFDNPILRNTMIWANGGGSYIDGRKGAPTPFIDGMCLSEKLYQLIRQFNLPDEQFLELKVHNFQKNSVTKYWLYYPIFNPNTFRLISFKNSSFYKIKGGIKKPGKFIFKNFEDYKKEGLKDIFYDINPFVLGIKSTFDFCYDRYNFIVSERLRKAIEAAGMDDVYFYDLDYEVVTPDLV